MGKLSSLIKGQKLRIDDHKRGVGEIKTWDDSSVEVHIDKTTLTKVDGKKQSVRIWIPINSDNEIRVKCKNKRSVLPKTLKVEIEEALTDPQTRRGFIRDLVDILRDYDSILQTEERASKVLKKLSKHFDLNWTGDKIALYVNDALQIYSQTYVGELDQGTYFIIVDRRKITIRPVKGIGNPKSPIQD